MVVIFCFVVVVAVVVIVFVLWCVICCYGCFFPSVFMLQIKGVLLFF